MKPSIVPTLLVPSESSESAVLKNLSEPEDRFDLSRFKARPGPTETFLDIITRPSREVFKDLADKHLLIVVWRYDNATRTWSSYDPIAPAELSDLTLVSTGDIVWIEVTKETQFQNRILYEGWNLISLN